MIKKFDEADLDKRPAYEKYTDAQLKHIKLRVMKALEKNVDWVKKSDIYQIVTYKGRIKKEILDPILVDLVQSGQVEETFFLSKGGRKVPHYRYILDMHSGDTPLPDDYRPQEPAYLVPQKEWTSLELLEPIERVAKEMESIGRDSTQDVKNRILALESAGNFYEKRVKILQSLGEAPNADRRTQPGATANFLGPVNVSGGDTSFLNRALAEEASKLKKDAGIKDDDLPVIDAEDSDEVEA